MFFIANFFLTIKAQCTKFYDFDSINGSTPLGSLIFDGTFMYGMTLFGGTNDLGIIFKIKPDGTGFSKLLDFAGSTNGSNPWGSLISVGTFLYGMTPGGGTNNKGVIFKIQPDGTGYSKLHDFIGTDGSSPNGDLFSDGTFLYGMTSNGGANGYGVVFKIMLDGTGYSKLIDFAGTSNGSYPHGSFISDGTFLYGMTNGGGLSNYGTIFKIKPDGTGYSKLLDLTGTANGKYSGSTLISDGTFLYAITRNGGINNMGVIIKIKPDGTNFSKLLDFTGANGCTPMGSLIFDGTFLYGTTRYGGADSSGVIFKIKSDGTNYVNLLDFASTSVGKNPFSTFISDSSYLYGMTAYGGINGYGTIFKYALVTNEITEKNTSINFNIYPNPTKGTFTIVTKENDYRLIITNVLGENVYQSETKNQKFEIDLSKQPKGIYFVKIYDSKEIRTKKVIVQ